MSRAQCVYPHGFVFASCTVEIYLQSDKMLQNIYIVYIVSLSDFTVLGAVCDACFLLLESLDVVLQSIVFGRYSKILATLSGVLPHFTFIRF